QQLEKQPDKAQLISLITKAAEFKSEAYTEASFADLKTALAQARAVNKDPEASVTKVETAVTNLKAVIEHLVKAIPAPTPDPAPTPGKDPITPPKVDAGAKRWVPRWSVG
ncbi:alpha-glucosidase, partial [Lacticaseibacillus rhamnosus MTCC 5462]